MIDVEAAKRWDDETLVFEWEKCVERLRAVLERQHTDVDYAGDEMAVIEEIARARHVVHVGSWRAQRVIMSSWTDKYDITHELRASRTLDAQRCGVPSKLDRPSRMVTCLVCIGS